MKLKLKVRKFGDERKVFEIPQAIRDNFEIGETYDFEQVKDIEKITRLEVIEVGSDSKRKYVKHECLLEESIQDQGRTLKIFVEERESSR